MTARPTALRIIKAPDPAERPPAVEVVELSERDSGHALLQEFGIVDFADTEPATLELVPVEAADAQRLASPRSVDRDLAGGLP